MKEASNYLGQPSKQLTFYSLADPYLGPTQGFPNDAMCTMCPTFLTYNKVVFFPDIAM